jgi:hypothetical protein
MKKILLLMLTLLTFGFAAAPLSAQNNTLTVYDGTTTSNVVPAYIYYFDDFTRCQFVIPEADLGEMATGQISSITFYTTSSNVPYTTVSTVDVYLMTVDYTSISAYEDKDDATIVYTGTLEIASANDGGELTITFNSPYTYTGGNLLIGIENTTDDEYKNIYFYGQTVAGASIAASNGSSLANVSAYQRDFIPKTTFTYTGGALCKTPKNLRVTDVTTSSATVIWHGDENASSYNILYMADSVTDWNNAQTATSYDTTLNLSNLSTNTTYKVKVQTACSDNTETFWSSEKSFTTECESIEITDSWFENFEGYSGSGEQPFVCWSTPVTYSTPVSYYNPVSHTYPLVYCGWSQSCHSGSNSAEFKGSSNMLVLPEFTNDLNTLRLTFWATAEPYPGYGSVEVGVITDINDPTSFELVGVCGAPGPRGETSNIDGNGSLMGPFDFNGISATEGRIALRYSNTTDITASWNLDDFTVTFIPDCAEPTNLVTGNLTSSSAEVSWNEMEDATYDLLYWEVDGDTTTVYGASLTDSVYAIEDLFPNTTYGWTVRTVCADGSYANAYQQLTFTTPNVPVVLPYERTFEEGEESPATEFTIKGSGDNRWTVGSATFKPQDPDDATETGHSLYISYDNGETNSYSNSVSDAYAILNLEFDDSPLEYHLSFDYKVNGEALTWGTYDYLSVYLMDTSEEVPTSGVPSGTALLYQKTNITNWESKDFILPDVTGTSKKIVFYWRNDASTQNNPPAAIDNIRIQGFSCAAPSNLTTTGITSSSATVNWQENGSATSWTVYYRPAGTETWISETANDESLELTGLSENTSYEFKVTADCSGEESNPSSVATFRTACGGDGISLLPFNENFEIEPVDGYVPCWTRLYSNPAHKVYLNTEEVSTWGSQVLDFGYTPDCYTTAVLPMFSSSIPINTLQVEFDARRSSTAGTFLIGAMTDPEDDSTFVVIDTIVTQCSNYYYYCNWEHFVVLCNNYTGDGQYLAFRVENAGNSPRVLDNLSIKLIPQCPSPEKTSVEYSNVSGHSATISWVDNIADHDAWVVYYKPSSSTVWSTADADATSIELTGLYPETQYDVYVITNCGYEVENPDATQTIHFQTAVACPAPTGLAVSSISTDEATITWTGTADSYNVEYGEAGFTPGEGTPDVALTNSITLSDLTPSTSYTIYVNADCTEAGDSLSATISLTFSTTQIPTSIPYTADFSNTSEWRLNNGSCQNYWMTGVADSVNALFVTNNGSTPGYDNTATSVVSAEKLFTVGAASELIIDFDVKVGGESIYDFMKLFLAPATEEYPASTSTTYDSWDYYSYSEYAFDFSDYLSLTTDNYYPFKYNLTNNNTVHITAIMQNPNDAPDATSTAKVVFVWRNDNMLGDEPGAIISNLSVSALSCNAPTAVTVSNVLTTSADLTWTAGDNETEWEIEYGLQNFSHGAGTIIPVTGTANYSFVDLTASTHYDVYVRAICAEGDSSVWSTKVSFSTACEAFDIPLTENFDSYEAWSVPTCWKKIESPGSMTGYAYIYGEEYYSGTMSLRIGTNYYTTNSYGFVRLPLLNTNDLSDLQISFMAKKENGSRPLQVAVSNLDDYDPDMTVVATIEDLTNEWTQVVVPFSSYTGNGTYIFIGIPVGDNMCNYRIDDIVLGPADSTVVVTCDAPTGLDVTNITENSATATWTAGGSETAWNLQYKAAAATNWGTVIPCTQPSYTFSNLSANTQYVFRVQANCGNGNTSAWTEAATFTTDTAAGPGPDPCDVPANLHATNTDIDAIEIAWDPNANVNSWNIRYRMAGNGAWNTATAYTNSYTLTGLTENTSYEIQVQANCGNNNLSEWSSTLTVTPLNDGIVNYLESSVTLFPNPAKEYVDVRIDGDVNVTLMEVYDVYGKLIRNVNVIDNPTRINVSSLANGMYFVRVTTNAGMVTKTFVKK